MMAKRCTGTKGLCSDGRPHGSTIGRTARGAAVYPFELCRAILVGLRDQLRKDGKLRPGEFGIQAVFEDAASGDSTT